RAQPLIRAGGAGGAVVELDSRECAAVGRIRSLAAARATVMRPIDCRELSAVSPDGRHVARAGRLPGAELTSVAIYGVDDAARGLDANLTAGSVLGLVWLDDHTIATISADDGAYIWQS